MCCVLPCVWESKESPGIGCSQHCLASYPSDGFISVSCKCPFHFLAHSPHHDAVLLAMPRARSKTHINALPTHLLAHIFCLCSDNASKAAVLATCRYWHHIAGSHPPFWAPGVVLSGTKLQQALDGGLSSKKALFSFLQRRKGVISKLRLLQGTTQWGHFLPAVLEAFQDGPLEDLSLELGAIRNYAPLAHKTTRRIFKEVLGLHGLRHLSLAVAHQSIHMDFTWRQLAALSCLSQLESLSLAGGLEGRPAPGLFAALSVLTSLSLRQDSGLLSSAAPLLEGLSRLQRVELCAFRLDVAPRQLEAQWQNLRELVLRSSSAGPAYGTDESHDESSPSGAAGSAWEVLPRLPQLTGLTVVAGLLAPLRSAAVEALARSRSVQSMRIGRYAEATLPDLEPGMLPALTRLRLSVAAELTQLPPSWCEVLAPSLAWLEVENCYRLRLPAELSRLQSLQRLGVNHQRLEEVPPALLPMSRLTRLSLCANTLRTLSPGPYLRNLRELVLFANAFTHVPPALGLATQLQLLDCTMNWDLELGKEDLEVLSRLGGSLRRLLLRRWPGGSEAGWCGGRTSGAAPGVERRLRRLLPDAEVVL